MKQTILILSAFVMLAAFSVFPAAASADMPANLPSKAVCGPPAANAVRCHARVVTNGKTGKADATISYQSGYSPASLHAAYNLPGLPAAGSAFAHNGQTIAIVDAYDNPNTSQDLAAYRRQFGLPLCADATASAVDQTSCLFTKVNQNGLASPLPAGNTGWGQETDLDIEMASATCPQCKILLVAANSSSFSDLSTAVDTAARLGANAISNSYGATEFSSETTSTYNSHFNHPGIAITVSSGDNGYGVEYPAASQYVTAVGGTKLVKNTTVSRGWTETAWSGAGSGCSAYVARQSWQTPVGTCTKRVVADVSAVADPNTGVAVYDSYGSTTGNWYVFGGTSVAAPIIAGVYALAANAGGASPAISYGEYPYTHSSALYDITSGSNGRCTTNKRNSANLPLCNAVVGYDGPTGLGSPNGVGAF